MGRKLLWFGGGALLLAALLLALLVVFPSATPFAFLSGHRPIRLPDVPTPKGTFRDESAHFEIYSFKGDYTALLREANKELRAAGYVRDSQKSPSFAEYERYTKDSLFARPASSSTGPVEFDMEMVNVVKDTRMYPAKFSGTIGLFPKQERGWITVAVTGKKPNGFLDRVRDWLGL